MKKRDEDKFDLPPRTVALFEELIEKSIKTGNIVSEKEFFAVLSAKKK